MKAVLILADWMDVDPPEKAIGAFHATVNVSATILFLISFLTSWGRDWHLGWTTTFVVALVGCFLAAVGGRGVPRGVIINCNA